MLGDFGRAGHMFGVSARVSAKCGFVWLVMTVSEPGGSGAGTAAGDYEGAKVGVHEASLEVDVASQRRSSTPSSHVSRLDTLVRVWS
jgi:hypothetical protein